MIRRNSKGVGISVIGGSFPRI